MRQALQAHFILVALTADYKIGTLDETYPFMVYQEMNLQDYHELGFMMAWGLLRDNYYDSNFHGANWNAIRDKYQAPARFAPSRSVYERIFNALNGELNSSHLGFYGNATSNKEWGADKPFNSWEPVTSHLGIIFDQAYSGEQGWMVKKVIPGAVTLQRDFNLITRLKCAQIISKLLSICVFYKQRGNRSLLLTNPITFA